MDSPLLKIINVVGPTASGKSQLALWLAHELKAAIVCTDSMQIYKSLDIGTAKPTEEEQQQIPHHMLDLVMPDEHYSAGRYEKEVRQVIAGLAEANTPVLLVGGTGLYFKCTLHGICETPEVPDSINQQIDSWLSQGVHLCHEKLQALDPECAQRLHPNDRTRIVRALGVFMHTGRSITDFQKEHGFRPKKYHHLSVGYQLERKELYAKINSRTHLMLEQGLIEEVQQLLTQYPSDLQSFQAIGYKQVIEYLNSECNKDEMIEKIQQKTRNYAKRQMTWFKKDQEIQWHPMEEKHMILNKVKVFLEIVS